jgi:hypothetical protein
MRQRRPLRQLLLAAAASIVLANCSSPPSPVTTERGGSGPSLTAYMDGVRSEAAKRTLRLSDLDMVVTVRGGTAITTVTATFQNPQNETLEGQFALNMPRGSVVTGYALDVGGTMIDGVLETKYKAAEAYQRRVTRRVDPGLVEVDYSDKFETRVYPIPGRGSRTIRLRIATPLDPVQGYVLPLTMQAEVGSVKLTIEGDARVVSLPSGIHDTTGVEANNVKLDGVIRLAEGERALPMLLSQHPGAEPFFDLRVPVGVSRDSQDNPLHIFWDRSVSRSDDELEQEAQLAEDFAKARGLRRVTVTMFDSAKIETDNVHADRLSERLERVRYRGGTSYAVLSGVKVADNADCLMFSDGRVSIDDRKDFSLPCATSAVASGPESDAAWLTDIAQRSGGTFSVLAKSNAATVLKRLQRPEAAILSVTNAAGAPIEAVRLPSDSGSIRLVGPLPDDRAVHVWLAGDASPRVFNAPSRMPSFAGPGALWARARLGVVASDITPDALTSVARRYNVATPQASFVVLESPRDYVQAKIEPPSSYPKELRATYANLRDGEDRSIAQRRESRLGQVVAMWNAEKVWWERNFDGAPPPALEPRPRPAPAAPAAVPPVPIAPPTALEFARSLSLSQNFDDEKGSDRVVVTGSRIQSTPEDSQLPVEVFTSEDLDDQDASTIGVVAARRASGRIEVSQWSADRPYLDRLDAAGKDWEATLDREMKTSGGLPLFWFDVAEWHWQAGRREEARRAVEAALDLPTRNNQTLAIVAARLLRYGSHDRAIWLLERLAERETDRPQPLRSLALALVERSKTTESPQLAKADLERAVELLAKAATDVFDVAPRGVEVVALSEANVALARLKALGGSSKALDERLVALLDADVRVVVEWNTPRTDLDLWVREPKGHDVGYGSPQSIWGGKLSADVTDGYGPEEYKTKKAQPGVYVITANTFSADRANPNGPSTLTVRMFRNYGRPGQTEELIDFEMPAEEKEKVFIGKITID